MENLTHGEIVRKAKERTLNFDLDGDGLTVAEELKYGLNPYCADTDGDNIPDGREVNQGSDPTKGEPRHERRELREEREREKERLRERYLDHACELLGWPRQQLDYPTLYGDVAGNETIGRGLDRMVFQSEVGSGTNPVQAAYLLAQSPWLQWHKERGALDARQMRDYASAMLSEYQVRF